MSENLDKKVEHTILPDGYFDLIVEFQNHIIQNVKLTGLWTEPIDVKSEKNIRLFSIRFKPLASEYLFDFDLKKLLNSTMILPIDFWELDTIQSDNFEDFATHISQKTTQILTNRKQVDERKIQLFDLIFQKKTFSVKEISEQIYWNSRQINRYFNHQFGIPLKTYLNIARCNDTYKKIARNSLNPQFAYFDQAHFIKEIKKLTGVSPKELSKNKNDRFLQLSTLVVD
jgi:AraC-like DNA-binding protein